MESAGIQPKFLKKKSVGIVGVSIKEGQNLEGPEKAPEYIRNCGLFEVMKSLEWEFVDYGDVSDSTLNLDLEKMKLSEQHNKSLNVKNTYKLGTANEKLHSITKKICENNQFCLTLGGDHGIATGSISGVKAAYPKMKVIWVDAHADCNLPEESPSGNYHGMPVAHLLGWLTEKSFPGFDWFTPCLKSEDIVFIGLRDVDQGEKRSLKKHGIKCFSMHEVVKHGIGKVMEETIKYLFKDGECPLHISFDIDGVDPSIAYGTGTKARGGLLYREAHYIMREVAATGCLVSLDMVEINPLLDTPKEQFHGDSKYISGTETVSLGIELISSALGETLL